MLSEVSCVVKNLPSAKNSRQHHCHICSKICLLESGLLKHVKSKHPDNLLSNEESSKLKYSLDLFLLKSFIEKKYCKVSRMYAILRMLRGNSKTFKFYQLMILYQPTVWCCQLSHPSMEILKNSTHSSIRPLVLQKIFTKISVVTVVFSLVLKLQNHQKIFQKWTYPFGYVFGTICFSTKKYWFALPAMLVISDGQKMCWWECCPFRT